ncbi:MAG TPA: Rv2175c family DNA-binding protein [Actinophytocola sp.]|uniref:Rv2175c family DNA-binding protein n=1 Tax=Actinophytocola sp. TaxID=1872138 RepID=UPI002DB71ED1|nr:Rv2175c family DNA-binding protein [Actinophytocola sp.]HEU5473997.1 Rv2175c family DNA-binding protein [Actinophytocola sp.]
MSPIPSAEDVLEPDVEVLTLPEVAARLSLPVTRVQQALRDGHLLAVRRDGGLVVPALFLTDDGAIVKGLPGTITVLTDSGFTPDDIMRWLFTADDSLPGTPIEALRTNRGTEVKRRAQALAF